MSCAPAHVYNSGGGDGGGGDGDGGGGGGGGGNSGWVRSVQMVHTAIITSPISAHHPDYPSSHRQIIIVIMIIAMIIMLIQIVIVTIMPMIFGGSIILASVGGGCRR